MTPWTTACQAYNFFANRVHPQHFEEMTPDSQKYEQLKCQCQAVGLFISYKNHCNAYHSLNLQFIFLPGVFFIKSPDFTLLTTLLGSCWRFKGPINHIILTQEF